MNDYINKKRRAKKLKGFLTTTVVILLVFVISILLYNMYENINVVDYSKTNNQNYITEKISTTASEIKEKSKAIADVIEEVQPSVVGISKIRNTGSTIFLEDSVSKLGMGTGMVVSENGYILTNEHVSGSKYSNCYVTLDTGSTYKGDVVWSDKDIDLSIVKINVKNLPYIKLGDSDIVRTGEIVYAIGNPIGFEFQRTVTSGIISAINRTIKIEEESNLSYMENLIQTDATINPGNSGGPLINPDGEVIGINSVKITSAEGIGFAVPINTVKAIIQSFTETGDFKEASLGIFAYDKNVIPYIDSNLKFETGIYVVQLLLSSPAYLSGLREGDIIMEIDEVELNRMSDLRRYIYTKNPGDEVILKILRNARQREVTVKLGTK